MKQFKFYGTPQAFSEELAEAAHPGQKNSKFRYGYENVLEVLPIVNEDSPKEARATAEWVLKSLAAGLRLADWVDYELPTHNKLNRTILGIAPSAITPKGLLMGAEIAVGHWGRGFVTPIHQHGEGFVYEEVLTGQMVDTTYRLVDPNSNTVRAVESVLFSAGDVDSEYHKPGEGKIHTVRILVPSSTLNFFPERYDATNGVGTYTAEYFETVHTLRASDLIPIRFPDYLTLKPGDVILCRSENAPYFDDHYEVIGAGLETHTHGHRLRKTVIPAPDSARLLDSYQPENGMVILQLKPEAVKKFNTFHNL